MDAVNPYAPPRADLALPRSAAAPKLWNPDAAGAWSLLLSPIFGASLVWLNWRAIGDAKRTQGALVWLLASIVFYVAIAVADLGLLALLYLIVWYFGSQRPQTLYVKKTWPQGYPRRSWRAPLLLALGAVLALFMVAILAAVATTAAG